MKSPLIERLTQARQHDHACLLCEHRCAVNRSAGELGVCKAGTEARVFRHRIECGEEPELRRMPSIPGDAMKKLEKSVQGGFPVWLKHFLSWFIPPDRREPPNGLAEEFEP
jgi:hypothetical protein